MHEWAIAESIVLYLKDKGYSRIKKVVVYSGMLQNLDKEIMTFAIGELARLEGLTIAEAVVIEEKPVFRCNTCDYEWKLEAEPIPDNLLEILHFVPEAIYVYYKCPRCGSRDFEIVRGRGISRIEVIAE